MTQNLIDLAIKAAIKQDWQKAIDINLQIISTNPNDIPSLNRLAKAYKESGLTKEAIETYQLVLKLDPYNSIALKNSKRTSIKNGNLTNCQEKLMTNFVDEPGKTRTLQLKRLGSESILQNLQPGQPAKLVVKNYMIIVHTTDNIRIGAISDEQSFNLKKCIEAGNQYEAAIKKVETSKVSIFIREVSRSESRKNNPTF